MNAKELIKKQDELDEEFIRPNKYSAQERVLKVLELKSRAFGYAEGVNNELEYLKTKSVNRIFFINSELKALQEAGLIPNEL